MRKRDSGRPGYVVSAVLRGAMFVPGQPAQRNVYQLTRRRGLPWTPGLDEHLRRRGGELPGHAELILVDIDSSAAVDGTPLVNAALAGRPAVEAGGCLTSPPPRRCARRAIRTAGTFPAGTCGTGPIPLARCTRARCHAIGLRTRGTCPGSPGYVVWSEPGQLPVFPRWIAELAGHLTPLPVISTGTGHGGWGAQARLDGIIERFWPRGAGSGTGCCWASLRIGGLGADGDLDAWAAGQALTDAAARLGLVREDGQRAVAATIRSGFEHEAPYEPAR